MRKENKDLLDQVNDSNYPPFKVNKSIDLNLGSKPTNSQTQVITFYFNSFIWRERTKG